MSPVLNRAFFFQGILMEYIDFVTMFCYTTIKQNKILLQKEIDYHFNIKKRFAKGNRHIIWSTVQMEERKANTRRMVYKTTFIYWTGNFFS